MRSCPGMKELVVSVIPLVAVVVGTWTSIGCLAIEPAGPNDGGPASSLPVASVRVSPESSSVEVGQTLQLTAAPQDSTGHALSGRTVMWTSSDERVATVSSSGRVAALSVGSATITAASEGKRGVATITVTHVRVAAVEVSPPLATLPIEQTVQFTATPKDADGTALTGRTVTWASSDERVAAVSSSGLVSGLAPGSAVITATSDGKSGTASVSVLLPPPPGSPDPTLLPRALRQAPDEAAYAALHVPNQSAGFSYNDPVTKVKIWKVTSNSMPSSNSGAGHDYGEGANQVSRGWGRNANTHTILIRGDGMPFYIVDFTRGVGFNSYRVLPVQPRRDMNATFSSVAGQERILYIHTDTQLIRFNTATMRTENTGNFPLNNSTFSWLHQDMNDVWFTGLLTDNKTVWVWNSRTNEYRTHFESWTNEPRLDRNGRYVVLTSGGSPSTVMVWDLLTNTFGPQQSMTYFSHLASLRGRWIAVNSNATAPPPLDRYQVVNGIMTYTPSVLNNGDGYETNNSGNWIQESDDNSQWAYLSGVDEKSFNPLYLINRGIGVVRADGSDARLLCHHYTHNPDYWDNAWGQPSPDGKVVIFNSNMSGSGRYDLFVAEVPLR